MYLALEPPTDIMQVLLLPGLCFFFGMLIWILGLNAKRNELPYWWIWLSIPVLALGLYQGGMYVLALQDKFYTSTDVFYGKKMRYSHYLAFAMPFLGMLVIGIWAFMTRKRKEDDPFN